VIVPVLDILETNVLLAGKSVLRADYDAVTAIVRLKPNILRVQIELLSKGFAG
jgi:hypothetical protein